MKTEHDIAWNKQTENIQQQQQHQRIEHLVVMHPSCTWLMHDMKQNYTKRYTDRQWNRTANKPYDER